MEADREKISNIEKTPVEREIFELEEKLAEKKKELEKGPKEKPEPSPAGGPAVSPPSGGPPAGGAVPRKPAAPPKKSGIIEKNPKIKSLVDKAFHEGIHKAVEEVKNMNDPYLIDAFLDALIDDVYQILVKEGLLKEV
ncbi:MAG: hypothetical protein Q8L57_00220 [bacterium]|nr:hypothetical protein [bacterium]